MQKLVLYGSISLSVVGGGYTGRQFFLEKARCSLGFFYYKVSRVVRNYQVGSVGYVLSKGCEGSFKILRWNKASWNIELLRKYESSWRAKYVLEKCVCFVHMVEVADRGLFLFALGERF